MTVKGAREGPAELGFHHHAQAPRAGLRVREVVAAAHILTDLSLGPGKAVHHYREPAI